MRWLSRQTLVELCGVVAGAVLAVAVAGKLWTPAASASSALPMPIAMPVAVPAADPAGIVFRCPAEQLTRLQPAIDAYLLHEGIDPHLATTRLDMQARTLAYTLPHPLSDSNTLDLIDRPALQLKEELVQLPTAGGGSRTVITVSRKEILYAMLQTGRTTWFEGPACDAQALIDQVGIRQNTVAWAESLAWIWPNGGHAAWNTAHWRDGNPLHHHRLREAINDAFMHQERYAIGCYTATKLVVIQGMLDYYHRVRPDPRMAALVQAQLMQDNDPLSHIEPGAMWHFEPGNTDADKLRAGKLMQLTNGIAARNFIPGDWAYFLNTDSASYAKTGYEGSNALYLGRGKFDDYYNDHNHSYTYKEKMHEVYQWRNKVFSRQRDAALVQPLSAADFERLSGTPAQGGIEMDYRAVPLLLGYQALPAL